MNIKKVLFYFVTSILTFSQFSHSKVTFVGASNTAGFGASVTMEDRFIAHIKSRMTPEEAKQILSADKKILVAIDYFFPTNFGILYAEDNSYLQEVKSKIIEWENEFDHVFIGKLPLIEDLSVKQTSFVLNSGRSGKNLRNIFLFAKKNKLTKKFEKINNIIVKASQKNNSPIFTIGLEAFVQRCMQSSFPEKPNKLFYDQIHFNDIGQAVALNALVLRNLEKELFSELRLGEVELRKLSKNEVDEVLSLSLLSRINFLQGDQGNYWFEFLDKEDLSKASANYYLPSLKKTIGYEETPLRPNSKEKEIINISKLIEGKSQANGYTDGFRVRFNANKKTKSFSLNLVSALFFTEIILNYDPISGVYKGWGYDHWLSYLYVLGGYGMYVPSVNYYFELEEEKENLGNFKLKWSLIALSPSQERVKERNNFLPLKIINEIQSNKSILPALHYEIKLKVKNLLK